MANRQSARVNRHRGDLGFTIPKKAGIITVYPSQRTERPSPAMSNVESIERYKETLRRKCKEFDKWASMNPERVDVRDPDFIDKKQEIKKLKLKINELSAA